MPFLKINAQPIFYTDQGGGQRSLLLIHGAGGSHLSWPAALRRAAEWRVFSVDLPGHGRSDGPGRDTVEAYAAVVQRVVEHLSCADLTVVGHSLGGAIALQLALLAPASVQRLVLIAAAARLPVSSRILENVLVQYPHVLDFMARYAWHRNSDTALVKAGRAVMKATPPEVTYADFLACNRVDLGQQLTAIQQPTLVISAEDDRMVSSARTDELASQIPNATHVRIQDAGHMVMLEQPAPVVSAIRAFVGG